MLSWLNESGQTGLVSVIMPTFNRSAIIQHAIESLKHQTYRPIECIVVDDGSTDDTLQTIRAMQLHLPDGFELKYFYQDNAGPQVARNLGTAACKGEFIQYLDSDDLLFPDKLKTQVAFLQQHPDVGGVYGDWLSGTEQDNTLIERNETDDFIREILSNNSIANFAFLMRRELVERTGEWDVALKRNQEIDYHLRASLAGGKLVYQKHCCGLWRHDKIERVSTTHGVLAVIAFYQKAESLLSKAGKFTEVIRENIADIYLWLLSNSLSAPTRDLLQLMKEAIRLNPKKHLDSSKILKLTKPILGEHLSIRLWIFIFRMKRSKR